LTELSILNSFLALERESSAMPFKLIPPGREKGLKKTSVTYELSLKDQKDFVRKLREKRSLNSTQINKVKNGLLEDYKSELGRNIWGIEHAKLLSALGLAFAQRKMFVLSEVRKRFPRCHKVIYFTGLSFKFLRHYFSHIILHPDPLQSDPCNTSGRKRKIVILKAKGRNIEEIRTQAEYWKQ
uniref:ER membrane protein complex subunit 2 n=1 Tax=Sus scrofa TaxID=9823 RepID=A0A8D0W9H2_PIG